MKRATNKPPIGFSVQNLEKTIFTHSLSHSIFHWVKFVRSKNSTHSMKEKLLNCCIFYLFYCTCNQLLSNHHKSTIQLLFTSRIFTKNVIAQREFRAIVFFSSNQKNKNKKFLFFKLDFTLNKSACTECDVCECLGSVIGVFCRLAIIQVI